MFKEILNKTCIAILAITAIEITALLNHIDGIMLSLTLTAVAGLGGFEIGKILTKRGK